jgi:hypothetical protein
VKEVYRSPMSTFVNMRCIDCFKEYLEAVDSDNGGGFIEDARFMIEGSGVCQAHAKKRLTGSVLVDEIHAMMDSAKRQKRGK